tara:strand:- start:10203 stop:10514 length:312 start_codon:yes stop_codon:yes gene_type:complete
MEIFKQLPLELKNYIMYKCNGLQHPTAKIMKEFIEENNLYKTEQFREPSFYQFLRTCRMLTPQIPIITIIEYDTDGEETIFEYPMSEEHFYFLYESDNDEFLA